jgi:hypothetical protein
MGRPSSCPDFSNGDINDGDLGDREEYFDAGTSLDNLLPWPLELQFGPHSLRKQRRRP